MYPELAGSEGIEDFQGTLPDAIWLKKWLKIKATPIRVKILPSACLISTPLSAPTWTKLLDANPNRQLVQCFLNGITNGFQLEFNHTDSSVKPVKRSLPLPTAHREVVEEYLQHEISMQRVAGPFPLTLVPYIHISRCGFIPKSHQINKWRLILDFSFPKGKSVNDRILKDLLLSTLYYY